MNREIAQEQANRARGIVDKAKDEGRGLTSEERKEVKEIVAAIEEWKDHEELRDQVEQLQGGAARQAATTGGFAKSILDAGFDLKSHPAVEIPSSAVFNSTLPSPDVWRRQEPVIAGLGQDRRFLFSHLPTQNVDEYSAVQDFKQTVRTLTGTAVRELDAVTDKASLDVTLTSVVEKLKQVAVTINDIPNAIFDSVDPMRNFLNSEGAFQVQKALDAHVMAQIVAAAPPFGTTGTGLVARLRNGIATMRATGANPTLAVINPTDSASLDLEADAGGYIFPTRASGSSSPLWDLQVIERIGAGTEAPYLIDPLLLGQLYLGNVKFEADPFTGFKKNLTTLRIECTALYHVRQAEGARRVNAT